MCTKCLFLFYAAGIYCYLRVKKGFLCSWFGTILLAQ